MATKRKAKPPGAEVAATQVTVHGPDGPICRRCDGSGIDPMPLVPVSVGVENPKTCRHPVGRRIGDQCAACLATVGTPDRRYGR